MYGGGDGIKIQHSSAAFLHKTFGYGIYADKELYNPKQTTPNLFFRRINCKKKNKNCSTHIK